MPSIRVLQQEQVRIRACLERAKWRSGVGAPTAEDLGEFKRASPNVAESSKGETSRFENGAKKGTLFFFQTVSKMMCVCGLCFQFSKRIEQTDRREPRGQERESESLASRSL